LQSWHEKVFSVLTVLALPMVGCAESPKQVRSDDQAVVEILQPIRERHAMPALAAAVVTSRGITSIGAVGVRKAGTDTRVTLDDKWHLGSNTKAMTAMLIADLVEDGLVSWDSTLAEVFPEDAENFHEAFRTVTLRQLLSHHAGLPANLDWARIAQQGSLAQQRTEVLKLATTAQPASVPGSTYLYSNLGYVVAGAVAEKVTRQPWEDAIRERIFTPLGMKSVGFGGVGTVGELDQPWPHMADGRPASGNGPEVDNPHVMAAAGGVHCTLSDWCAFIVDQLKGSRGDRALLGADAYEALQSPAFGGNYAFGWVVTSRPWAGGKALSHAGSNTLNFANVWVAPVRDFAVVVCVNQGGDEAFRATDEAVGALVKRFAGSSEAVESGSR